MAQFARTPNVLEEIATLRDRVARLERAGRERDELPFYPTSARTIAYEDATSYAISWETILSPRTATLSLGLVLIGDAVGATNSGGDWQVVFNDSTVVASGSVPATGTWVLPALTLDLTPYLTTQQLKVQIKTRRTAGATTGGKYGTGGCIGSAPRYARLI